MPDLGIMVWFLLNDNSTNRWTGGVRPCAI
jgi:hypothetical protein